MLPTPNNVHTQRESAIQHLVEQTDLPRETIEPLFDSELEAVRQQARISQFVPLVATRRVVRRLKDQTH